MRTNEQTADAIEKACEYVNERVIVWAGCETLSGQMTSLVEEACIKFDVNFDKIKQILVSGLPKYREF